MMDEDTLNRNVSQEKLEDSLKMIQRLYNLLQNNKGMKNEKSKNYC